MNKDNPFDMLELNISPEELAARQQGVMRLVFLWMTAGLGITALVALAVLSVPELFYFLAQGPVFWGLIIAQFAVVIGLSALAQRLSASLALAGFVVYAVITGLTMSMILALYTASSVAAVFFSTAGLFGAMAVIGYTTKVDLTKMGSFLLMALVGLVIAGVVNLFFASSTFELILNVVGVFIFIGLTAYKVQHIKNMTLMAVVSGDAQSELKLGILGALTLYLTFINLFLRLLSLFGRRR